MTMVKSDWNAPLLVVVLERPVPLQCCRGGDESASEIVGESGTTLDVEAVA